MVVMYVLGLSLNVFYSFGLCLDYRNIYSGDMGPEYLVEWMLQYILYGSVRLDVIK